MTEDQPVRALPVPVTRPARYGFDNDQLALMKRTVCRGADDSAFALFLELVGRYKLDPFAGQAYLAKMPGKDGEPPTYKTIVGRDGLLVIANRYVDFHGMDGDVIYATDTLARTPEGFVHTYAAMSAKERLEAPILGSWARVLRAGRQPTFFLAKMASYRRKNRAWDNYPDAMILKVAQSLALRLAFSITGLLGEDEVGATYTEADGGQIAPAVVDQEPDWGEDEALAGRLRTAFAEANRVRPGSFLPQKIRLALAGADRTKREQILIQVTEFAVKNGGSIPIEGTVVEDDAA